jgi:hypothetical protein
MEPGHLNIFPVLIPAQSKELTSLRRTSVPRKDQLRQEFGSLML